MIHAAIAWAYLRGSRRATFGAVLLGFLALAGVFAEILASSAPLVAAGPAGVRLLPGVVHASLYEGKRRSEIDRMHAADTTIWPLVRYGPTTLDDAEASAPTGVHLLGMDAEGRDLFARLVWGARTALGLSAGAVLLGMFLGVALGGLAGHERGFWNDRLVRLVETVDTFPAIIVVALVRAIEREPSARSLVLAVGFVRWAEVARLVRAEVLRAGAEEYVVAARALGASPFRVFWRHILPSAIGPAIVSSVFGVASVVLLEAAISFLKMGAPTRAASWGETLAEGAQDPSRLRLIVLPALLLAATVGASHMLASALRDATDPRAVRR
ncbi:Oligopeptide transport system permease protein OppC [Minicystis rosea]|nr:Oligopeptide transport system permease protein OppC [Minicystis rosea]